jgi:hypothetical protein
MLLYNRPFYLYILGSSSYGYIRKRNQLYNEILSYNKRISLLIYSFIMGSIRFPLNILYDARILRYNHSNKYIKYMHN